MPSNNLSPQKTAFSRSTLGLGCCALAALSYAASNVCSRQMTTMRLDPVWVTCGKETAAFSFAVGWALFRRRRGLPVFPPRIEIGILILVGLAVQLIGNLGSFWTMGKIGLVIAIPTNSGSQLLTCALFGWLILGERVSFRSGVALGALMIALVLLGLGAEAARGSLTPSDPAGATVPLAVCVSLAVGVVYAAMSIAMRRSMNRSVERCAILFFISGVGIATMWPLSFFRLGLSGMAATSSQALAWMLAASFFNLVGFLGFAKGLQLTTVVHANFLNATQVALLAVAGMAFFHEPNNPWLIFGVLTTLLGILLIDRPPEAVDVVETTV
ncbi:MAG: DMT family transporter [Pirellulales bacterium]|nr:DMT family transporter [Pirellulales bacterium]